MNLMLDEQKVFEYDLNNYLNLYHNHGISYRMNKILIKNQNAETKYFSY